MPLPFFFADSSSGISSVPDWFVKYFVMMAAFFGGLWLAYRRGQRVSGTREEPINIAQPLAVSVDTEVKVRQAQEWASKSEVAQELASLEQRMEAMGRENLRQHNATAKQIADLLKAGADRRAEILQALHGSEQRTQGTVLQEARRIHERLNPVAEGVTAHESALQQIHQRIAAMEAQHHADAARINTRIDDAIRATSKK